MTIFSFAKLINGILISSLKWEGTRVLQWVPIPMGTQYPPIPMGKWVGNGYGLGCMGGYEGPGLYND